MGCAAGHVVDAPDLPPIAALAELLAERLGADGMVMLSEGPYPSAALRFVDHHPVLVRTFHGGDAMVSLPKGPVVELRRLAKVDDDLRAIRDGLRRMVAEPLLGLTDVVVALQVPSLDLHPCTVDWPGVGVPDEAWLRSERGSIGLFHRPGALRAVVWVGHELNELELTDRAAFTELARWIPPRLERQRAAAAADAAELARLTALPVPTLDDVWAHLRAGRELTLGGGRWSQRYWLRDGVLWSETQDEGAFDDERVEVPDRALQAAIDFDPIAVRRILEQAP
jgi:hypothetical protein